MALVDLRSFGQLSLLVIERRARFPSPSKSDRCHQSSTPPRLSRR